MHHSIKIFTLSLILHVVEQARKRRGEFVSFVVNFCSEGGYFPDGVGGKPWVDSDPNAVNSFYNAKVFLKIFEDF